MVTTFQPDFGFAFFFMLLRLASIPCIIILWWNILRKRSVEPTCGKCGYVIVGQTTLHCSECGGDLREFGIQTATPGGMRKRSFLILWTILSLLLALCWNIFITPMLPTYYAISNSDSFIKPHSQQYYSVTFETDAVITAKHPNGSRAKLVSGTLTITLDKNKQNLKPLKVNINDLTCTYDDIQGKTVNKDHCNADIILDWMKINQINTSDDKVLAEANAIMMKLLYIIRNIVKPQNLYMQPSIPGIPSANYINNYPFSDEPIFYPGGGFSGGRKHFQMWQWTAAKLVAWLLIWLGGFMLFIKARKKHIRQLEEAKSNWPAI